MSELAKILRASLQPLDLDPPLEQGVPAGVVVPVLETDPPSVIFTRRTDMVRDHKGEISFPGGVRHVEDRDLLGTALRETEEELGIPRERFAVLGGLMPVHTFVSGYVIAPFVGLLGERPELVPSPVEIAEVIEVDLGRLLHHEREVAAPGGPHATMFVWEVDGHVIWGATGRILHELLEILRKGGWS